MRPGVTAQLYRVRLKGRSVLAQEALAVLGIAIGVALLFASQVLSASPGASVQRLTNAVVGRAQLQIAARSTRGFDERELEEVQRLPGVDAAVPVLEQSVRLIGAKGDTSADLVATDPRYASSVGGVLRDLLPALRHELLHNLARSPGLGERSLEGSVLGGRLLVLLPSLARRLGGGPIVPLHVQVGARIVPSVSAVVVRSSKLDPLTGSRVALMPLAQAQGLTGMRGKLTRILVRAKAGQEAVVRRELRRVAAGRQNVEPAGFDVTLFDQAATPVRQSTGTFAGICALVGFMFAYCSILLTAATRRRLIKELHLLGATRRQIVQALLFDAAALGVCGCVAGLALGELLSILAFNSNPGFLSLAFPVGEQRIVTFQSIVLAAGAGLLAACVGVLAPLWEPRRARRGLAARASHRGGLLPAAMFGGGAICLAATTVVLLVAPGSAILGIAILIVALLLLLPPSVDAILKAFGRVQRLTGARAPAIAILELRAPAARIRSIAIASTAAIAVFGGVTIQASRDNLQAGLESAFHGVTAVADLWVVPAGSQSLVGTVPFVGPPASRIDALPGVEAAGAFRASFLDVGDRRVWVLAPSSTAAAPVPRAQLVEGGLARATARLREGGWAVLSRTLAERWHLRVGQRFTLPSPRPVSLRVAALITNLGWSPGSVMLSPGDYVRAWESPEATAYNVKVSPGVAIGAVANELRRYLLGEGLAGLAVQTAGERERRQLAAARQGLERLTQMTILALLAGILATGASMAAVLSQRRTQVARLKTHGLSRNMLWLALVWEGTLLIGAGCLVGAVFGVYGELLLSHALVSVTGFPVAMSPRLGVALEGLVAVTIAAALAIAVPGFRAASVAPSVRR